MKTEKRSYLIKILFVVFLLALFAIEAAHAILKFDDDLYLLLSRFVGGGACIVFMVEFNFTFFR